MDRVYHIYRWADGYEHKSFKYAARPHKLTEPRVDKVRQQLDKEKDGPILIAIWCHLKQLAKNAIDRGWLISDTGIIYTPSVIHRHLAKTTKWYTLTEDELRAILDRYVDMGVLELRKYDIVNRINNPIYGNGARRRDEPVGWPEDTPTIHRIISIFKKNGHTDHTRFQQKHWTGYHNCVPWRVLMNEYGEEKLVDALRWTFANKELREHQFITPRTFANNFKVQHLPTYERAMTGDRLVWHCERNDTTQRTPPPSLERAFWKEKRMREVEEWREERKIERRK